MALGRQRSPSPALRERRSSPPRAARSVEQLLRDMGIEHVYDSRSTEFADAIRRDTEGYGVDIVLNSVTGAAQRAGIEIWRLVDDSSRSVNATSTATPGWDFSRSVAT